MNEAATVAQREPYNAQRRLIDWDTWQAEGVRRFGKDMRNWQFVCPICGHVAKASDWEAIPGARDSIAFSCIGRYTLPRREAFEGTGPGPCNYAGGGLFKLNPVFVEDPEAGREPHQVFAFAPAVAHETSAPGFQCKCGRQILYGRRHIATADCDGRMSS